MKIIRTGFDIMTKQSLSYNDNCIRYRAITIWNKKTGCVMVENDTPCLLFLPAVYFIRTDFERFKEVMVIILAFKTAV